MNRQFSDAAPETTRSLPLWHKPLLTLEEAALYFNVGVNKIRSLTNEDGSPFVLWVGSKRLIKRERFEDYLNHNYSV